ncbi:hypothetical protein [Deinococcus soli (ex Cha et al. 2016)]|uniref:Uncharacterized protein n=2 Tax=Deinococcus soli (ex Cha et al. 2016) TaxID=1309411 RepID=A0ACC6KBW8_9DEIO|nr:hypothetical protein [Deinococcus soli (ex Cha et al. 2016)]MDR6216870.1 hypothetical protein [Deinococcus soli (ex Cha et al. 2016)]MDR6327691.1 hypothetical protein [Deinococcus soli (ex Cha et al. 2016)]MDR6749966.1 hypothetical protein [Deinococcus soli (ex Cha et al. 2016)]
MTFADTSFEARTWALMGLLSRADGSVMTLAEYEDVWDELMSAVEARGLRFSGRAMPLDLDHLSPQAVRAAMHPQDRGVNEPL